MIKSLHIIISLHTNDYIKIQKIMPETYISNFIYVDILNDAFVYYGIIL